MTKTALTRVLLAVALVASPAAAQTWRHPSSTDNMLWPAVGGVTAIVMQPTHEFGRNDDSGVGLEASGSVGLDPWGILRLRGSFGGAWYGFLLVTGHQIGLYTALVAALLVACFVAALRIALARTIEAPPPAGPTVRGPGGYAGPGSLGGTESALSR